MLWNAGLAAYHAGVEWKWWAGPQDCCGRARADLGPPADLLKQLGRSRVVRCDEAAWRFLGLSLAGYNVLISLALARHRRAGALRLARAAVQTTELYGSSSVSQ